MLKALTLLAALSQAAAPAKKAAPPKSEVDRACAIFVEARAAHALMDERSGNLIGIHPLSVLRSHRDFQDAVLYSESRPLSLKTLDQAVAGLPASFKQADPAWLAQKALGEIDHAEADRKRVLAYLSKVEHLSPPQPGLTTLAELDARALALLGQTSYATAATRLRSSLEGAAPAELTADSPTLTCYVAGLAASMRRVAEAWANDAKRLGAESSSVSHKELQRRLRGGTGSSMSVQLDRIAGDLKKPAAALSGRAADRYSSAAKADLRAAAAAAASAVTGLEAARAAVKQGDAKEEAATDPEDEYGPDLNEPELNSRQRDALRLAASIDSMAAQLP